MARTTRRIARGAAPLVLLTAVLTGCTTTTTTGGEKRSEVPDEPSSVGARDSGCALPVSFDLEAGWQARATDAASAPVDSQRVAFSLVCELDGSAAGHAGRMRVWTAPVAGRTPEQALRGFVGEVTLRLKQESYAPFRAGALAAVEARFSESPGPAGGGETAARAFVVGAADGLVIVQLGGLGGGEDPRMLPAYEQIKKSVRAGKG
ncbi:lipoprotein [Streptomyces sp. NPDC057638]|uniref:lipoprotein n=1 Tax=Streptomyces sp. NPDC057638 TaxID=3346190 RepID=UPI00368EC121